MRLRPRSQQHSRKGQEASIRRCGVSKWGSVESLRDLKSLKRSLHSLHSLLLNILSIYFSHEQCRTSLSRVAESGSRAEPKEIIWSSLSPAGAVETSAVTAHFSRKLNKLLLWTLDRQLPTQNTLGKVSFNFQDEEGARSYSYELPTFTGVLWSPVPFNGDHVT